MSVRGQTVNSHGVTVITATRNNLDQLQRCIQSVGQQRYTPLEHIVVDAASTDGTVEYLAQLNLPHLRFISEVDTGIADAMNKGIRLAASEYIVVLHADDLFLDNDVLQKIFEIVQPPPGSREILAASVKMGVQGSEFIATPTGFGYLSLFKNGVLHQGAICPKRLFDELGYFSEDYKVTMDFDWFLRARHAGIKAITVPVVLARMKWGGISTDQDWPSIRRRLGEERKAQLRHAPHLGWRCMYHLYWFLYWPYRWLRQLVQMSKSFAS